MGKLRIMKESTNWYTRGNPILGLDDLMPWGKYKGKKMSELLTLNPGYIRWLVDKKALTNITDKLKLKMEEAWRKVIHAEYTCNSYWGEERPMFLGEGPEEFTLY